MDEPIGKFIFKEVAMLDYKSIVRLKRLGLNNAAIANSLGCKWDSVQRIVSRCENVWGSVDGVPDDLTNEEIADILFSSRKSVDLDYLQPDCEKILEKQRKGYLRNELWTEYCAEAGTKGKKVFFARPKCTKLQVRNVHLCMYILYIVAVVRYYPDTLQTFRF